MLVLGIVELLAVRDRRIICLKVTIMGQEFSLHLQKKTSEKRIEQVNNVYIYIYIHAWNPKQPLKKWMFGEKTSISI